MTDEPRWPEWMDLPTLPRYIGSKPSTVRTLLKHGAIPRPSRWGNIALWNRRAVDGRLMMGGPEPPEQFSNSIAAATITEGVRRMREEDKEFNMRHYRSVFDLPDSPANIRRRRRRMTVAGKRR
jgi:hypothetical protein